LFLRHIQHTTGIYGFFARFIQIAKSRPDMNSAGGKQEKYASDVTGWVSSGTISGQMRWPNIE
jgi:hypothetical protein